VTTLECWISQACDALGLQADFAYVVDVGDDREVRAFARIRSPGGRNGVLVVRNYDDVRPHADALARAGYGFSVLDEPRPDEAFDLDLFKEMFCDWGGSESK
jgi:hypothetical protein